VQQFTQSWKPSDGQADTQSCKLLPSSPPVHDDAQGDWQVWTQSANLSSGHAEMQALRSSPVQPHEQVDGDGLGVGAQGDSQVCTHSANLSEGQEFTHSLRSSPVQPHVHADGDGVGGAGVGGGVGVGAGVFTVPLVTHPPHSSSRGESTADFIQHSWLSCTHVKPTQPAVDEHSEQQASALFVLSADDFRLVPSLFFPGIIEHWPAGVGLGGPGDGCGPEHFVGSGPCTTEPDIFKLLMEK
jgi:hypothetical protein